MTIDRLEPAQTLIPGAFERSPSPREPVELRPGAVSSSTAGVSPAVTRGSPIAAPQRPETWLARAGAVLWNLLLAMLLVTMVPLGLMVIITTLVWLVRTIVGFAGRLQ